MKPRIGFKMHVSNSADGWGAKYLSPLIAAGVPPVVMTLDNAGPIYEAQVAMTTAAWPLAKQREAVMVFRLTPEDVPDYRADPKYAAEKQWAWHLGRWPKELDRRVVWFGIVNEPAYVLGDADLPAGGGPYRKRVTHNGLEVWDNAEWLAAHAYRLCQLALKEGMRFTCLGWAPGTPEPWQWTGPEMTRLLDLLREYPDQLGIDLHEGSMTTAHLAGPWLIGRWRNIPQPWPSIFVTEFGWTLNDAPPAEAGMPMLREAYRTCYAYGNIKGIALWTLGKEGAAWGDIGMTINQYMEPVANDMIHLEIPSLGDAPPVVTPPPTEPAPTTNLLINGSFDEGWTDADTFPGQHPKGWEVVWNAGELYHNPHAIWPYHVGEGVHKSKDFLPAEERAVFIWDGDWTYKLFADKKAFWARLKQTTADLPAGKYRLSTPVWVDCYRWVGFKDYAVEPWQAEIRINVNDKTVRDWALMVSGGKRAVVTDIDHAGGPLKLGVHLRCNWPISNNLWLDGWELTAVKEAPPPPPPPTDKPVLILDVSKWQGSIDTAKMKAAGVDGVMLRASYSGTLGSKADEKADEFAAQLKAAGIPYGFYHYYHNARPVEEQFAAFKSVVDRHGYTMRLALDLEEPVGFDSSVAAKADDFLFMMDEAYPLPDGKAHMVYTSMSYWRQMGSPNFGDYELWIAAWTTASTPAVPSAWSRWQLWQHSNNGTGAAYGVGSLRVDLNRFNGSRAEFAAWQVDGTAAPEPFPAALWADAAGRKVWDWNPTHALAKKILADGLIPAGYEWRFEHGDKVYFYQIAINGARTMRRVYYAQDGKWNDVRWIAGPDGAKPAPPPIESAIDLLPYLKGDGRLYEVRHPDGQTETFQTQTDGDWFYLVKNSQWEQLYADSDYIWRGLDTSPGNGRYYIQYEPLMKRARWMPRRMRVGQTWVGPGHMVQFYTKADCRQSAANSGAATNVMTFKARHAVKEWNGVKVEDVVELTNGSETWFYARNFGLVAWSSAWGQSAIVQVFAPGERPDNVRETGCFG